MLREGLSHTSELTVKEFHSASSLGSGDLEVFGTPAMLALMENAAMLAVANELPEGYTTVGGQINVSHLKPTAMGRDIKATAVLTHIEGKKLLFDVMAYEEDKLIGKGTHLRFIVHKEKFLRSLQSDIQG